MEDGTPFPSGVDVDRLARRFWAKVDRSGECWMWTAALDPRGYGAFGVGKRVWRAHRVAYALHHGTLPDLELDHLCRVPGCVRPEHLEPVTHQENMRRSPLMGSGQRNKTVCPAGHPYDETNTYRVPSTGERVCRKCRRDRLRAKRAAS